MKKYQIKTIYLYINYNLFIISSVESEYNYGIRENFRLELKIIKNDKL